MRSLFFVLSLIIFNATASAAPISFTGAELLSATGISFPTGTRTVVGDSLQIESTALNSVVARLPLDQFVIDLSDFEVQLNITRTLDIFGAEDSDPSISITDGVNVIQAGFGDGSGLNFFSAVRTGVLTSDETAFVSRTGLDLSDPTPIAVGSAYTGRFRINATATATFLSADLNGGNAPSSATTPTVFDPSNGGLSLLLAGNHVGETYLINSLTFTRGVSLATAVPEPNALAGLGVGLLGFSLYRRRRR